MRAVCLAKAAAAVCAAVCGAGLSAEVPTHPIPEVELGWKRVWNAELSPAASLALIPSTGDGGLAGSSQEPGGRSGGLAVPVALYAAASGADAPLIALPAVAEGAEHGLAAVGAGSWLPIAEAPLGTELLDLPRHGENPPQPGLGSGSHGALGAGSLEAVVVCGILVGPTGVETVMVAIDALVELPAPGAAALLPMRLLVPLTMHDSVDAAMDEFAPFLTKAPDGGISIDCISAWIGTDGVQCCGLAAAHQYALSGCDLAYGRAAWRCLRSAGIAGGSTFAVCAASACLVYPSGECLALCGILGLGVGVGEFLRCWGEAYFERERCRVAAKQDYVESLVEAGCWPPPAGFEP